MVGIIHHESRQCFVLVCETTYGQHISACVYCFFKYIQTFGTVSCMQKLARHQASRYQEKVLGSLESEGCSLLCMVKSALHVPDYCNFNVDSQYVYEYIFTGTHQAPHSSFRCRQLNACIS